MPIKTENGFAFGMNNEVIAKNCAIFTMDGIYVSDWSDSKKITFKLTKLDGTIIAEGEEAQKSFDSLPQRQRDAGLTTEKLLEDWKKELKPKRTWFEKIVKYLKGE